MLCPDASSIPPPPSSGGTNTGRTQAEPLSPPGTFVVLITSKLSHILTSDPNSATSQFFINVVDNARALDAGAHSSNPHGYCVFGKVVEGMDVADQIRAVPTDTSGHMQDVPVEPIVIESVNRD